MLNDLTNLDYSAIGSTEKLSTYRDPCNGSTAPLLNVLDASNNNTPYCSGNTLVNPGGRYTTLTNSAILAYSETSEFAYDDDSGFRELYAQAFAYVSYAISNVGTPADLTHTTTDTLFANAKTNTYVMNCVLANANAIWNQQAYPPAISTCQTIQNTKWTYTPFGMKTH